MLKKPENKNVIDNNSVSYIIKIVNKNLIIPLVIILPLLIFFPVKNYMATKSRDITVLNQIEEIKELITARQIYREIIYSKETKDILWIPILNKEFLISLDYNITAGIDISKGYKITKAHREVTITLPRAEILSIDADDTSIKQYFIKERFSKLQRDDYFIMIQESKKKILEGESIKTLLAESENNAKDILTTLLQISGITVNVKFSNTVIRNNN